MRDDIPKEDMPPQRRFVLTAPPPGCDVAEKSLEGPVHGIVRRQESEDFYTQLQNDRLDAKDYRLEIDVVRGQRLINEIELHEIRRATQRAEDDAVRQMMRIHVLEARA
ncbi:hypothetical protein Tco_0348850 [Tanacetum coccineum]